MKRTVILTQVEKAAVAGSFADVAKAQHALAVVQATAESIVSDILAAHRAPAVRPLGQVTTTQVDGSAALVYDADEPGHGPGGNGTGPEPEPEPVLTVTEAGG